LSIPNILFKKYDIVSVYKMGKMKEVFDKLKILQDILLKQFKAEEEIEEIPRELNRMKAKYEKVKRNLDENNSNIGNYTKTVEELRKNIETLNLDKQKYENQILQIKTQKEYEALTSEIAQIEEKITMMKEEEDDLNNEIVKIKKEIEKEQVELENLEESISVKEKKVKELLEKKQEELNDYLKEREKIAAGLDEEIIYKFEKIVKKKDGIGIVSIRNNVCMGCNMILPPQFINDVRREDSIIFCPNCSRILYFYDEESQIAGQNVMV